MICTFQAQVHEQCPVPSCVNHQECLGSGELGEGGKGSCYLKPFGYWWQGPLLQQDQGVRLSTAFEIGAGTLNTFSVLSLGLRASVLALSKTTGVRVCGDLLSG